MPFFEKYNLQLRVYDEYMKLIFKYDPVKRDHHNKTLFCMVKEDHVYTLNNNLKELQQHSAVEDKMLVKASENYYIKDDPVTPTFKMIDGVDDIIKFIREAKKDKTKEKI